MLRSASLQRAGLLRRLASVMYEALLLVPVLFIAAYLFLTLTQSTQAPLKRPLFQLWLLCVLGVYFIYCWTHGGQTLAMKTWRIRVAQADGAPVRVHRAAARFLLALWGLFLLGVGFWWALIDRDRQFLHDRLAGTRLFDHRVGTVKPRDGEGPDTQSSSLETPDHEHRQSEERDGGHQGR